MDLRFVRRSAAAVAALVVAGCASPFLEAPAPDGGAAIPDAAPLPVAEADASADAGPVVDAGTDAASQPIEAGACNAQIASPPVAASPHVAEGTAIAYATNPPSSGPHSPIWANFEEYGSPVDDGYLVHSMEHGAVLLLYRCDAATCAEDAAALRAVRAAVPSDPKCDPSIRVRVILAPRPTLDVRIAAAAWGATYKADCVDAASLAAWVTEHYAKAPEDFCSPGASF